jgi:acyl-CoA dehydrogenase
MVSTEGVRVVEALSACVGAKGFEADTYLEMALRDARLIPGLEGSAHINLAMTAQFTPRYFGDAGQEISSPEITSPASLVAGQAQRTENPYLMEARTTGVSTIAFGHYLRAYVGLLRIPNVRQFAKQARAFRRFVRGRPSASFDPADTQLALAVGQCVATLAYGQLIAEHSCRLDVEPQMVSAIFHLLVADLSAAALAVEAMPQLDATDRARVHRMVSAPRTPQADWDWVSTRMCGP